MKFVIPVAPRQRKFAPIPLQGDLGRVLPIVKRLGYSGIELQVRHPDEVQELELKDLLSANDLALVSISTGAAYLEDGLCLADIDADARHQAVERIALQCQLASSFGAMVVIGIIRGRLEADAGVARQQQEVFTESLLACADTAERLGVTLLVEPINRYETNFLNSTREALNLLDKLKRPNVLLMLDTFHMNIEEQSIEMAFADAAGRIGLVQLVDSNRCAPGMGHLNFGSCLAVLKAAGYNGYLSPEVLPIPSGEAAARKAIEFVSGLLGPQSTDSASASLKEA